MAHRNPFRIQAAQHATTDEGFIRLFSPGVLELLKKETDLLWERLMVFRSAPGGGKTSLFRAFTPGVLQMAYRYRSEDEYKEFYQWLRALDAVDDSGPKIVGILLPIGRDYRALAGAGSGRLESVFFALLNARLVLATLRTAASFANVTYPDGLSQIRTKFDATGLGDSLPVGRTADSLHQWASDIEKKVFGYLDSLGGRDVTSLPLYSDLTALRWLRSVRFSHSNVTIPHRYVVMMDDLQNLADGQRRQLLDALADFREPLGLWVSERLEALRPDALLSEGSRLGRDYAGEIEIERQWRSQRKRFQKFAYSIADLRARQAAGFEGRSFQGYVDEKLTGPDWEEKFVRALRSIEVRLSKIADEHPRYQQWVESLRQLDGSPQSLALEWRKAEILVERDRRREQRAFDFGDVLTAEELGEAADSGVRAAAEFFLADENKLPYFFGLDRLTLLASSNVEQFVDFAGDLFEEIVSSAIMAGRQDPPPLSPTRQEEILKRAIETRWRAIPRMTAFGYQAVSLLDAVGEFCRKETFLPNAPYPPGVTGIAITMADRQELVAAQQKQPDGKLAELASTIAGCVAQNLFEVQLDHKQSGRTWLLLYINRMLCVKFGLPLGYGGWRPQKLTELTRWMDHSKSAIPRRQSA